MLIPWNNENNYTLMMIIPVRFNMTKYTAMKVMKVAKTHYVERSKDNFKKSKNYYKQKIVWKVKDMVKGTKISTKSKFQPEKKEEKYNFFTQRKISCLLTEKKLTRDQKSRNTSHRWLPKGLLD